MVAVVVIALPFQLQAFRVNQMSAWMTIAIAALGLNLLTGFNGQISVGHGALFGVGAYTAGLMIIKVHSPLLVAVLAAGVVCFIAKAAGAQFRVGAHVETRKLIVEELIGQRGRET